MSAPQFYTLEINEPRQTNIFTPLQIILNIYTYIYMRSIDHEDFFFNFFF